MRKSKKLTITDYKTILQHYGLPLPKSVRVLQKKGEGIMARKLCSCIRKIIKKSKRKSKKRFKKYNKSAAIGICTYSIFKNSISNVNR